MKPILNCTICDLVRDEVNGKLSILGAYLNAIIFKRDEYEKNGGKVQMHLTFACSIQGVLGDQNAEWWIENPDGSLAIEEKRAISTACDDEISGIGFLVGVDISFETFGTYRFVLDIAGERCERLFKVNVVDSF